MTVIGRQDPSWEGHKEPPINDALGAKETVDYLCQLHHRSTTPMPAKGTAAGNPPSPVKGTKLTVYDYATPTGAPTAAVGSGRVDEVTVPAGHRWFERSRGDNFGMTTACIAFWMSPESSSLKRSPAPVGASKTPITLDPPGTVATARRSVDGRQPDISSHCLWVYVRTLLQRWRMNSGTSSHSPPSR